MKIQIATIDHAPEILKIQKQAYLSEAEIYNDFSIPPLTQSLEQLKNDFRTYKFYIAFIDGKIVGSVNIRREGNVGFIGRFIVDPQHQGQGIGSKLLDYAETGNKDLAYFELFTGSKSIKNIKFYKKRGYRIYKEKSLNDKVTLVYMKKQNRIQGE